MDPRLEFIFSRRSIRAYTDRQVGQDDIQSILEAAMAAPSASNRRPWHFVVVTDKEQLKALGDAHTYGKMLPKASVGLAICGDPTISPWWVQDCAAATENALIAAAALGLGAVWLGCHGSPDRERAIQGILGIPQGIGVLSLIAIGYPNESKPARTQYDPGRVRSNRW
jgi:nitroreductase